MSCASFVKLESGAEEIKLISVDEASTCEQLGKVDVKVLAKLGAIKRNKEKQEEEASVLARNSAKDFAANAVAPLNDISEEGKQVYLIYKC